MKLKPIFKYFGSKYKAASKYPEPKYNVIIEPFAGSAGYSLRYSNREVYLFDADPTICGVWNYLINVSEEEILSLPNSFFDLNCKLFDNICEEAKDLMGFCCHAGATRPGRLAGFSVVYHGIDGKLFWSRSYKERLAKQLKYIRHWKVSQLSFEEIDWNGDFTWFIDPPYQVQKHKYACNHICYDSLSNFCRSRQGQVIVCEQDGADWLPFNVLDHRNNQKGAHYHELIYTLEKSRFNGVIAEQNELFHAHFYDEYLGTFENELYAALVFDNELFTRYGLVSDINFPERFNDSST